MPESRGRPSSRKGGSTEVPKSVPTTPLPRPAELKTSEPAPDGKLRGSLRRTIGRLCGAIPSTMVGLSVVMTLLAGGFYFLPRVTVEPSGAYDPANPSSITFTISNINIVPLRDVQAGVGVCSVALPKSPIIFHGQQCNGPATAIFHPPSSWYVKWLDVDEKWQIAMEEEFIGPHQIENANVTIVITYTPWRMFWRTTKQFRFVTKIRSDGKIYWTPTPLTQ
jgi:hypothetical protein